MMREQLNKLTKKELESLYNSNAHVKVKFKTKTEAINAIERLERAKGRGRTFTKQLQN